MTVRRLPILLALLLLLTSCAPAAGWLRDQLDSHEGATLELVEGGVVFDPGGRAAYEVHLTLRSVGRDLVLTGDHPECAVSGDSRYLDCDFSVVLEPTVVEFTGSGVIGSANYVRQPGSLGWLWAYTPVE